MGSESTSQFEVRNPKSRKRTKKKDKPKDFVNETRDNTDTADNDVKERKVVNEQLPTRKKRRGRKAKSDNSNRFNGADAETMGNTEQTSNSFNTQENQVEEGSHEEPSPKKFAKMNIVPNDNEEEEIEAPKNEKNKEPSKRQIKREKAEKRENDKREASRLDAVKKALNYVSKWKYARNEWKFEKLKQIWLIDNLLDENSISDDIFPTVLEYFEGCKGMAREQLLKKGMDVIKKVEEDVENKEEILESVAYKRARKLLQALPTET